MAFVLENSVFAQGLQDESCLLLSTLKHLDAIAPTTITDIKNNLNNLQPQMFDDAGVDLFLTRVYSLNLDYSQLTLSERTLLNLIREHLQPAPSLDCCGVGNPDDPNTTLNFYSKVGSPTFEHEAQIQFLQPFDCDIAKVKLGTWVTTTGPAQSPIEPVLNSLGCLNGKQTFSYLWVDFAGDPTGHSYDMNLIFLDKDDNPIGASIPKTFNF